MNAKCSFIGQKLYFKENKITVTEKDDYPLFHREDTKKGPYYDLQINL